MGTSTPFGGAKNGNPLLPSWLEDPSASSAGGDPNAPSPQPPAAGQPNGTDANGEVTPTVHLTPARILMNRRLRSGGGDRQGERATVARALGAYVRHGAGGGRTAGQRIARSSGGAVERLGGILFDASQNGIRDVVRRLNVGDLAQRSLREIYAAMVDFVCGDGGDLDVSMNRDAYLGAVDELSNIEGIDLEKPSVDTINLLIERFIAGTIENRVKLGIGRGMVLLPKSVEAAKAAERDILEFVGASVSAAIGSVGKLFARDSIRATIERIYTGAMVLLETYADEPAGDHA